MNLPALIDFNAAQLRVIRQMCAKDCNDIEFDAFLNMCRARGLNPLLKHIYVMVLNKNPKKDKDGNVVGKPRQLVTIVSVDGQRTIASRTKNYRPDNRVPRFEIDPDGVDPETNPIGLISAEVSVFVHSHGDWHEVPYLAYYDEYAPIVEEWAEDAATGKRHKTGKKHLDPQKPMWRTRGRGQLSKCAEVGALRKAFPDDFGGLYDEAEIDKAHSLELTASEILEEAAKEHRMQLVGGPGVMIDWMSGGPLDKVPLGQLHDRAVEYVRGVAGSPAAIKSWEDRNRHALRDLWAYSSGDGADLKEEIEKAKAVIIEPELPTQETSKPKKNLKIRGKAQLDEKIARVPTLRLHPHQGKKP